MLSEHETEAIKTMPRHTLMRLVKYTQREDLYDIVSQELSRRETEKFRRDWIQIMIGTTGSR
jgi:hypothetical protein